MRGLGLLAAVMASLLAEGVAQQEAPPGFKYYNVTTAMIESCWQSSNSPGHCVSNRLTASPPIWELNFANTQQGPDDGYYWIAVVLNREPFAYQTYLGIKSLESIGEFYTSTGAVDLGSDHCTTSNIEEALAGNTSAGDFTTWTSSEVLTAVTPTTPAFIFQAPDPVTIKTLVARIPAPNMTHITNTFTMQILEFDELETSANDTCTFTTWINTNFTMQCPRGSRQTMTETDDTRTTICCDLLPAFEHRHRITSQPDEAPFAIEIPTTSPTPRNVLGMAVNDTCASFDWDYIPVPGVQFTIYCGGNFTDVEAPPAFCCDPDVDIFMHAMVWSQVPGFEDSKNATGVAQMQLLKPENAVFMGCNATCIEIHWKRQFVPNIEYVLVCPDDFEVVTKDTFAVCCNLNYTTNYSFLLYATHPRMRDSENITVNASTAAPNPRNATIIYLNTTCVGLRWRQDAPEIMHRINCSIGTEVLRNESYVICCRFFTAIPFSLLIQAWRWGHNDSETINLTGKFDIFIAIEPWMGYWTLFYAVMMFTTSLVCMLPAYLGHFLRTL